MHGGAPLVPEDGCEAPFSRTIRRLLRTNGPVPLHDPLQACAHQAHVKTRRQWALAHTFHDPVEFRARALFCDEAHIYTRSVGSARIVWCMKGSPLAPRRIAEADKYGGGQIMVSNNGLCAIVPVKGTLSGGRYIALLKKHIPDILAHNFPPPTWPGTAPISLRDHQKHDSYESKLNPKLNQNIFFKTTRHRR